MDMRKYELQIIDSSSIQSIKMRHINFHCYKKFQRQSITFFLRRAVSNLKFCKDEK